MESCIHGIDARGSCDACLFRTLWQEAENENEDLRSHLVAVERERDGVKAILKEFTSSENGLPSLRNCSSCKRPFVTWSVSSALICEGCRCHSAFQKLKQELEQARQQITKLEKTSTCTHSGLTTYEVGSGGPIHCYDCGQRLDREE